jgi:hypothetical protein
MGSRGRLGFLLALFRTCDRVDLASINNWLGSLRVAIPCWNIWFKPGAKSHLINLLKLSQPLVRGLVLAKHQPKSLSRACGMPTLD